MDAFRSTLEEVSSADLILHIVDASFAEKDFQIEVTEQVLGELGASDRDRLLVFNKTDLVPDFEPLGYGQDAFAISCRTGRGIPELLDAVKEKLFSGVKRTELLIPYDKGSVVNAIINAAKPMNVEYRDNGTYILAELTEADRGRYAEYIISEN